MSAGIQLFTFFISFLYGILFSFLTRWHFHVILSNSIIMKHLSTILFMIDVVLGYVIIMYHINQGVIHIYFLLFVFFGFILENILHKYVKLPKCIQTMLGKFYH